MASTGRTNEWAGLYFYDGQPYTSQPGIQGFVFRAMLLTGLRPSGISFLSIFFVTLLFNYLFLSSVKIIKERFGTLPAALFSAPLFLSTFYWFDSGNLYWLYPLYIAPFFLMLSKADSYSTGKLHAILFFLFLAKFCTGFEYAPVIILSAVIPIVISEIRLSKFWVIIRKITMISFVGVLAFVAALLILVTNEVKVKKTDSSIIDVIQSYFVIGNNEPHFLKYKNSISTTIDQYKILNNTIDSTESDPNGWSEVLKARDTYLGYSSLSDYFSFSSKKAIFYSMQAILAMALLSVLVFLAMLNVQILAIVLAVIISAIAAAAWVVLMPMHFYLHAVYWRGISDIILIFPFYSMVGLAFGVYLKKKINKRS
jgi:hypothetical protein